jgi:histidine ammonia-lyase
VAENRMLGHPASIDTVPTSANQEDHVSMATHGARRLLDMAENTATVAAIELLASAQGLDFRRPLKSSPPLEEAAAAIRARVRPYDRDRYFAPDIEAIASYVRSGELNKFVSSLLPSMQI